MSDNEKYISGIHNYCDRWCERCDFTARCSAFALERELFADGEEITAEKFERSLTKVFGEIAPAIAEKAEQFDVDLDIDAADDAFLSDVIEKTRQKVKNDELHELAHSYAFEISSTLENADALLASDAEEDPFAAEMVEILRWYQFFIAAKVHRGLHGTIDFDGDDDSDEIRDPQSDTNGSIKIGLIAVERSILAWTYLLSPENAELIRPFIRKLETLKKGIEHRFPLSRKFVRPGFDELSVVM